MTTENDFQNMLDTNPDDHHTRLVFADWLEEHNDPRAAGYRALGTLRKKPIKGSEESHFYATGNNYRNTWFGLPDDWFSLVEGRPEDSSGRPSPTFTQYSGNSSPRRVEEDKAALAFSKLPPERQAELMSGPRQLQRAKRRMKYARSRA